MKVSKTIGAIIWSDNYEKLAKWYEDELGFTVSQKLDLPNDTFIGFDFGNCYFSIGKHDKVEGQNKDPFRIMISFTVPSISESYNEIKDKNITFIATPFEAPPKGIWCMTLQDPDGNIIQFFGGK